MSSAQDSVAVVSSLEARRARRQRYGPGNSALDVASELLTEAAYPGVSLSAVAARCGTSLAALSGLYPTKDALIASIYLRRLQALPLEIDTEAGVVDRLTAQVRVVANLFADHPHLGVACNIALMRNDDPAIVPVRAAVSTEMRRRIAAALGSGAWPEIHNTVETVVCGALLQVGAGLLGYRQMVEHVETMLRLLLPDA